MGENGIQHRRIMGIVVALCAIAVTAVAASGSFASKAATTYVVRNLVSDGGVPAEHTDPNLVNGWGIAASTTSPWWVADNGTDKSTLYDGNGIAQPLVVSVEGGPTGTVFNGTNDFVISDKAGHSGPARFLFASENGTIHGWNPAVPPPPPSTHAFVGANRAKVGAIYKGLAIAGSMIYAADFHNARVDVFDGSFKLVTPAGAFKDPNLPDGYGPFGIQNLGGKIYVSYAKQDADKKDEIAGLGLGIVDVYDTNGVFLHRVATGGELNAPWGLAWAPDGFGQFSGDLLVGNFGDGKIHAYRPLADGSFAQAGVLAGASGAPIVIDGLWGIGFGNGAASGPLNTLYFAAGPDDEAHGLFGRIDVR